MSFSDCVNDAMDEGSVDKLRGKRAKDEWAKKVDQLEGRGYSRSNAEAMAAEYVQDMFRREAAETKHVFLARMFSQRRLEKGIYEAKDLAKYQTRRMENVNYTARGLVRRFNNRLGAFLKQHHRDLLGNVTNPAQMKNIVRELHGEASGDAGAAALAQGIREATEELRLMFNEAGGIIGKLDDWGIPHSHNRRAVTRAGFDRWFNDINERIDWTRMEDYNTGKPFQADGGPEPSVEAKAALLREVYDNIAYGQGSKKAVYGRPKGTALYKSRAKHRVLHFKDADSWVDYNRAFGSGDPFKALMGHVHGMARDIALMREFGPNPNLGADYRQQLAVKRAREEGLDAKPIEGNGSHAARMLKVQSGGKGPETLWQDYSATFFSTTRHIMTAAFLDRAVLASISDANSMRMAARAIGMNPANVITEHGRLIKEHLTGADALRQHWVAESMADPGVAMARFQAEIPPAEVAERLSSAAMRIQGLNGWTDAGRMAFQFNMHGAMADFAGKNLNDIDHPIAKLLRESSLTDEEWAEFAKPELLYKAPNGGTFMDPMWWRESTDLPRDKADAIFDKVQAMIEEQTEYAVPSESLLARGVLDPAGGDYAPGSLPYELMKSGLMFKSFTMTFMVNQYRRMMAQQTLGSRVEYAMQLVGGMTLMGAVALQLTELIKGNDPMEMNSADFLAKAVLKGGGLGIVGDILVAGSTNWGGGFGSYLVGPMPQLADDVWGLTAMNAWQFATGQETKFAAELARMGKRYTPMGQTPLIGPAMDRLLWDQLQLLLDPESVHAMKKKAQARENRDGNGSWWMPGSPLPTRSPDLGALVDIGG